MDRRSHAEQYVEVLVEVVRMLERAYKRDRQGRSPAPTERELERLEQVHRILVHQKKGKR